MEETVIKPRDKFQASLTKTKKELTPEQIEEEKERQKQIDIRLQKEFDEQLALFATNEDYFADYRKYTPLRKEILVKLFKFTPSDKEGLGDTGLFMVKSEISGEFKPRTMALSEKIYPIVKVIKVGADIVDSLIKPGKLYTVPWNDVIGTAWNPDFLGMMNGFAKKGETGAVINIPADMEQRISNLELTWERYKFSMPDRVRDETKDDKLVYLIPEPKLTSIYEFNN